MTYTLPPNNILFNPKFELGTRQVGPTQIVPNGFNLEYEDAFKAEPTWPQVTRIPESKVWQPKDLGPTDQSIFLTYDGMQTDACWYMFTDDAPLFAMPYAVVENLQAGRTYKYGVVAFPDAVESYSNNGKVYSGDAYAMEFQLWAFPSGEERSEGLRGLLHTEMEVWPHTPWFNLTNGLTYGEYNHLFMNFTPEESGNWVVGLLVKAKWGLDNNGLALHNMYVTPLALLPTPEPPPVVPGPPPTPPGGPQQVDVNLYIHWPETPLQVQLLASGAQPPPAEPEPEPSPEPQPQPTPTGWRFPVGGRVGEDTPVWHWYDASGHTYDPETGEGHVGWDLNVQLAPKGAVDLGERVRCPFPSARVWDVGISSGQGPGKWLGVVVLHYHDPHDGLHYYARFGHLDPLSEEFAPFYDGAKVDVVAGEVLGRIGPYINSNGILAPHLHHDIARAPFHWYEYKQSEGFAEKGWIDPWDLYSKYLDTNLLRSMLLDGDENPYLGG